MATENVVELKLRLTEEALGRERQRVGRAEAANDRARALHPSAEEAQAAQNALCLVCCTPAPCATRTALDAALDDTAGT